MKKNLLAIWRNEITRYRYLIGAVALTSVYLRFGGAVWELKIAESVFITFELPKSMAFMVVGMFDVIVTTCLWFSFMVCASIFQVHKNASASILCIAMAILLFAIVPAYAGAADETKEGYIDSRREWYFYKKEKIKPDTDEKKVEQKPAPSVSEMSVTDLWNMHPDQFKDLIEATHKRMVQYPEDDKAMGEWVYLKDIARRKSMAVASSESAYIQRHPEYNMSKDNPISSPGRAVLYKEQRDTIESRIRLEKENFGMIFFYEPGCGYCEEQSNILRYFIKKYNWDIKGVDITRELNAKTQFNIVTTPTLLLVQRSSGESMTISVGVVSLDEIEGTLYRSIRLLNKEITPEQWNVYDFQKGGLMDPLGLMSMEKGNSE